MLQSDSVQLLKQVDTNPCLFWRRIEKNKQGFFPFNIILHCDHYSVAALTVGSLDVMFNTALKY